jgi:hypothetical protein
VNDDAPLPDPEHELDWHLEAIARERRAFDQLPRAASDADLDADLEAWPCHRLSDDDMARFMIAFCESSRDLPRRFGRDLAGGMIWHVMGSSTQAWMQAARARPALAADAVLAVRHLYTDLFQPHLTGMQQDQGADELGGACYMLWDMDGLQYVPTWGGKRLAAPCFDVLEAALALDNLACQESALHGLGHMVFHAPTKQRAVALIDAFLERSERADPGILDYARAARTGGIQ